MPDNEKMNSNDGFADAVIQERIDELKKNKKDSLDFINRLEVYFGDNCWISDDICICQPIVEDFITNDERNILAAISPFTATPTSHRVQLWDAGIDWNDFKDKDIELSSMLLVNLDIKYTSLIFKRVMNDNEKLAYINEMIEDRKSKIFNKKKNDDFLEEIENIDWKNPELLKPLELNTFRLYTKEVVDDSIENASDDNHPDESVESESNSDTTESDNTEPKMKTIYVLYSEVNGIQIPEDLFKKMCLYIRFMFNSPVVEDEYCRGKSFKRQLIQKEKLEQLNKQQDKDTSSSVMLNKISFALNHPGFKYKMEDIRKMNIVAFNDCIQRLLVYESTHAIMGGMYSGMCDLSKVDKERFNFMRDFD